jgi:hypothetical protein
MGAARLNSPMKAGKVKNTVITFLCSLYLSIRGRILIRIRSSRGLLFIANSFSY